MLGSAPGGGSAHSAPKERRFSYRCGRGSMARLPYSRRIVSINEDLAWRQVSRTNDDASRWRTQPSSPFRSGRKTAAPCHTAPSSNVAFSSSPTSPTFNRTRSVSLRSAHHSRADTYCHTPNRTHLKSHPLRRGPWKVPWRDARTALSLPVLFQKP